MWEFRMAGTQYVNDCVDILHKYQANQELWDPTSLCLIGTFENACKFVNTHLNEYKKEFNNELIQIAYHPDRLPCWNMTIQLF